MEYYRSLTDEPKEILLPIDTPEAPDDFAETCCELGATWLLASELLDSKSHEGVLERIRAGPPP